MTRKSISTPYATPRRMRLQQFARNGLAPSALLDTGIATQLNHLVRHKRKLLFCHGLNSIVGYPAAAAGASERLRFRFLTGTGAVGIRIRASVRARTSQLSSTPYLRIALTDVVAATTDTYNIPISATPFSTESLNALRNIDKVIPCDEKKVYTMTVSDVDNTLVASIMGVDVAGDLSDEEDYYLLPSSSVGTPILAPRMNKMRDIINDLYTFNGPHLISWSAHSGLETVSSASTSYVRVHPTGVDYLLALAKMARRTKTTVPVVFAAIGSFASGTHDVSLFEGANNKATVTLTTSGQWATTTANLDASDLYYSLQYKRNAGGSPTILGATCYVYDP